MGVLGGWRDPSFRAPRIVVLFVFIFNCPQGGRCRLGAGCRPCVPWVAGAGVRRVCGRWARRFSPWCRGAASSLGVRPCAAGLLGGPSVPCGALLGWRWASVPPLLPAGCSRRRAGAWVALGAWLPCLPVGCSWAAFLSACVCGRFGAGRPCPWSSSGLSPAVLRVVWVALGAWLPCLGGSLWGVLLAGPAVGLGHQCPLPSPPSLLSVASGSPAVLQGRGGAGRLVARFARVPPSGRVVVCPHLWVCLALGACASGPPLGALRRAAGGGVGAARRLSLPLGVVVRRVFLAWRGGTTLVGGGAPLPLYCAVRLSSPPPPDAGRGSRAVVGLPAGRGSWLCASIGREFRPASGPGGPTQLIQYLRAVRRAVPSSPSSGGGAALAQAVMQPRMHCAGSMVHTNSVVVPPLSRLLLLAPLAGLAASCSLAVRGLGS